MPNSLASYLEASPQKIRIGYSNLNGYEQTLKSFLSTGNEGETLGADARRRLSGYAGTGDLSGLSTRLLNDFLIDDQGKKQGVFQLACAYSWPLKKSDGSYFMASSSLGNNMGNLSNQPKGIPSTFDSTTLQSLNPPNGKLQAGVGLDLNNWAKEYMEQFFNGSTVTVADLCLLAQKNKLCAEIVVHSSGKLESSGKVVYANVVDVPANAGKTCYISPVFCYGLYKNLGLDFSIGTAEGLDTFQKSQNYQAGIETTYDYKTGNLNSITKEALQGLSATGSQHSTIVIYPQCEKCCRIRLFVADKAEAESTLGKKLPDGFDKTNAYIEYVGGIENIVNESSKTYSTVINEMIAQKAEDMMKLMSEQGFLYSQGHNGIKPIASANIPESTRAACDALGLKYCTSGLATLISEKASAADKSHGWACCDCSLFVSWVLMECGVLKARNVAADFKAGTLNLERGFHLEPLNGPEIGCIMARTSPVGHAAIALSSSLKADFGGTKWWSQYIPAERRDWGGTADSSQHGKTIQIFNSPQGVDSFEAYWRVVKDN